MRATEKARQYAQTPFGIRPVEYGAFLDGYEQGRKDARTHEGCNYDAAIFCNKCGYLGNDTPNADSSKVIK